MALSDPSNITLDGTTPIAFSKVSTSENKSVYKSPDGEHTLTVSHIYGKRVRRVIRLDMTRTASDLIFPDQNSSYSASVYLVLDQPKMGWPADGLERAIDGLANFVGDSGFQDKFVQGQN